MSTPDNQGSPTRPYLLRALHDWCTDNGFTPYIAVHVDGSVQVPSEYVKNQEIVLNIGFEATSGLKLGNELIEFKARFGGIPREIRVPVDHVVAIYARENGQGMAFPMPAVGEAGPAADAPAASGGKAPRPATRGLRLAQPGMAEPEATATPGRRGTRAAPAGPSRDPEMAPVSSLPHATPAAAPSAASVSAAPEPPDEPPSPPDPGAHRPPLKRIK